MSFVFTAPGAVSDAAGDLAGIGSTLTEARVAAASPTTSLAAAAADEVSIALSQLFGTYGQQFQALSAQAATFHDEFVRLINRGAAAYLNTEIASAQGAAVAAPTDPLLGGIGGIGGGGGGPLLPGLPGGLSPGLPALPGLPGLLGLFGGPTGSPTPTASPYQVLIANTAANLQTIGSTWAAHPFPALQQVISNQQGYAGQIAASIAYEVQNFPAQLQAFPAQIQAAIQSAANSDPVGATQAFINKQVGYGQVIGTSLTNAAVDLQTTFPVFQQDIAMSGQAALTGDYHGAVAGVPRAFAHLFLSGVELRNLQEVVVHGPAGELLPIMDVAAQIQQDILNAFPPGSIPRQMTQNLFDSVAPVAPSLGVGLIGPPIAALDGLATGATVFGTALQSGDLVGAAGAVVNTPAYVLDGFLNGRTVIDLTIPVTETVTISPLPTIAANTPVVVHLPFYGILAAPQPISATIHIPVGPTTIPLTVSYGSTEFGGLVPELVNYIPRQIASTIKPD